MKMSWFRAAALFTVVSCGSMAAAEEPAKIHSGMQSADGLIKDMEYLTVKLAKQEQIYNKNIKPNIEIFLIGVNAKLPVGMSFLFVEETGQRTMLQIPVEVLKADFIDGNLDPIGIAADKDRKDKTLYKLSGDTFKGWMRAKGNNAYASISKESSDVLAEVVTPDVTLNSIFAKGNDFAVYSLNTEAESKVRSAAFKKLKDNRVSALKKKTDETQEAFDLRKLLLEQQMNNFGQLFANTELMEMGWETSEEKKQGLGYSHWTALPNTAFATWLKKLEAETSHFSSLTGSDKSVLTARVMLPFAEKGLTDLKAIYKLSPIVLKQQIEADKELSADEKAASIGATDAGLEALNKSLDMGVLDMFMDIAPSEGTFHTFVLGMRSVDNRTSIETLVGHLGKVRPGWSSKVNIETIGETKFHSFTVAKAPQTMLDFYGGDGTVYVAAGPDFVGFSTGVGSLDVLKNVTQQALSGEKKALEAFVDVQFHARESLKVSHAFLEEKDFDLLRLMQNNGLKKSEPESKTTGKDKDKKGSGSASDKLSALKNFDWEQTAIDAMLGTDDMVIFRLKLVNGAIDGETKLAEGVLTGMGAVISKFAKENLGN